MGGRGCLSAKQHREQRQTSARSKTASLQLENGARKTFPSLSPPFTSSWERETLAEVLTVPARRPRPRSRREGDREEGKEGGSGSNGARRPGRGEGEQGRAGAEAAPRARARAPPATWEAGRCRSPSAGPSRRERRGDVGSSAGGDAPASEGADGPRRGGAGGGAPGAGPRVTWPGRLT